MKTPNRAPTLPVIPSQRSRTESLIVRPYRNEDLDVCLSVIRQSFWDVYRPGCIEHAIWRRAHADHPDLLPGQSFVAFVCDELVGCMMSTRGHVVDGERLSPVAVLGPLGVLPRAQRRGVGSALMDAAVGSLRAAGESAAFLYGEPTYYRRFGFEHARRWHVATADGTNLDVLMGLELRPGGLADVRGRLAESPLYEVDTF